jgi:trans-2,3-dihydro-3-hydroxyanthranilate isomerase
MRMSDDASSTGRQVRVLRVFTREGQGGNHLGVVDEILDDATMAAIAHELGYSETIFLAPPDREGVRPVRIFTPSVELPFAGHPLVGATWHVAHHHIDGGEDERQIRLRCGIGVVSGHGHGEVAEIEAPGRQNVTEDEPREGAVASWIVEMPLPYEVHQLADAAAVRAYALTDRPEFRLVWAPDDEQPGAVHSRFFACQSGVDEDPATGSAAVALAAVLRREGDPEGTRIIYQGDEIGHPSTIHLSWDEDSTTIGGTVAEDAPRRI